MRQQFGYPEVTRVCGTEKFGYVDVECGDVTNIRQSNTNAWSRVENANKNASLISPQWQTNQKSTTPWPALGQPRNRQTNTPQNANPQSVWTQNNKNGPLNGGTNSQGNKVGTNSKNSAHLNTDFLNNERGSLGVNRQSSKKNTGTSVSTQKSNDAPTRASNVANQGQNLNVPRTPLLEGGRGNQNTGNTMMTGANFAGSKVNNGGKTPAQEEDLDGNVNEDVGNDQQNNDGGVQDFELREFSEELLTKDINNAARFVTVNYQGMTTSRSMEDKAPQPLFTIDRSVYTMPSVEKVLLLHNNYILEANQNEVYTAQEKIEENNLLDTILSTPVMQHTRNFLLKKVFVLQFREMVYLTEMHKITILQMIGYGDRTRTQAEVVRLFQEKIFGVAADISRYRKLGKDPKEFKDLLRLIWFNMYSRGGRKDRIEREEEKKNNANYLGYLKKIDLGNKGAILKTHFTFRGVDKPVGSMFIGTSPELEIALYTACFVLRADRICPLKMGGSRFIIRTYTYRYRGKNTIGSAFPEI
ncbi:hypothetical protein NQ318_001190 [Aromia moschata]|uniref:EndoU domain-containing protein n=1 Tax=Aromia moschata TaxID=1265417 RepID=A0AAV8ZGE3_9CUCU|nr:hypothetical protein NQ318_001190 [Aromia moschata]